MNCPKCFHVAVPVPGPRGPTGSSGFTGSTGFTGATGPQSVPIGNVVFVDAIFGNDATGQRQDETRPFLTLAAASTAAIPGDTVYVWPGDYSVSTNLVSDGIAWFFSTDVVVTATAIPFNTTVLTQTLTVTGYGNFIGVGVPIIIASGISINFYAQTITSDSNAVTILSGTNNRLFIYDSISTTSIAEYALIINGGVNNITVPNISSSSVTGPGGAIMVDIINAPPQSLTTIHVNNIQSIGGIAVILDDTTIGGNPVFIITSNIVSSNNSALQVVNGLNFVDVSVEFSGSISPTIIQSGGQLILDTDLIVNLSTFAIDVTGGSNQTTARGIVGGLNIVDATANINIHNIDGTVTLTNANVRLQSNAINMNTGSITITGGNVQLDALSINANTGNPGSNAIIVQDGATVFITTQLVTASIHCLQAINSFVNVTAQRFESFGGGAIAGDASILINGGNVNLNVYDMNCSGLAAINQVAGSLQFNNHSLVVNADFGINVSAATFNGFIKYYNYDGTTSALTLANSNFKLQGMSIISTQGVLDATDSFTILTYEEIVVNQATVRGLSYFNIINNNAFLNLGTVTINAAPGSSFPAFSAMNATVTLSVVTLNTTIVGAIDINNTIVTTFNGTINHANVAEEILTVVDIVNASTINLSVVDATSLTTPAIVLSGGNYIYLDGLFRTSTAGLSTVDIVNAPNTFAGRSVVLVNAGAASIAGTGTFNNYNWLTASTAPAGTVALLFPAATLIDPSVQ